MFATLKLSMIAALIDYGITVTIYDPLASPAVKFKEYKLTTTDTVPNQNLMLLFYCRSKNF
jgi:hypothetical protein